MLGFFFKFKPFLFCFDEDEIMRNIFEQIVCIFLYLSNKAYAIVRNSTALIPLEASNFVYLQVFNYFLDRSHKFWTDFNKLGDKNPNLLKSVQILCDLSMF